MPGRPKARRIRLPPPRPVCARSLLEPWAEASDGHHAYDNEHQQHNSLGDRKRWLGSSWRQNVEAWNLQERLRNEYEHVEVQAQRCPDDVYRAPLATQVEG